MAKKDNKATETNATKKEKKATRPKTSKSSSSNSKNKSTTTNKKSTTKADKTLLNTNLEKDTKETMKPEVKDQKNSKKTIHTNEESVNFVDEIFEEIRNKSPKQSSTTTESIENRSNLEVNEDISTTSSINEQDTIQDNTDPTHSKEKTTEEIIEETLGTTPHIENKTSLSQTEEEIALPPLEKIEGSIEPMVEESHKTKFNESDFEKTIVLKKISNDIEPKHSHEKPKKAPLGKRIFAGFIIIIICIGLLIGGAGIGIISQILANSPELNLSDFTGAESSKVYDANGDVITELGAYLRENVTYDDLPESIVDAFVAIEDSRFFTHPGFDLPRFTKAFIENLKTMSFSQGGSTFTMQLVKNTYFSVDDINASTVAEKSIDRKVQEIFLALKIETEFNKKDIFVKYLNKLNFGGNIRGVQKASLYYFGKNINDISLSEAALLAGIVNLPNKYNPYYYLDYATQRRNEVLDMMVYHGYITQNECDLAKAIKVEDLLVGEQNTYSRTESQHQSYIDAVIQEAQALTGKDPALNSMTIYTYMVPEVQDVIDSIQDGTAGIPFPDDLMQTAMISMDNRTGAIVGIGGGRNYEGARLLNRATSGYKQPGSAVKPFLSYALAFEHLYWSSQHVLTDRPYTYRGSSLVLKNFDGKYRGDVIIDQAFGESLNIPAIDTLQQVIDEIGKEKIVQYLNTIGFTKVTNENFDISYAIGGSTFETTVLEMAGAHAMIINGGVYNKPHTIQKIVMQDGTVVYPEQQNVKVLSTGSAYLVSELMNYAVEGPYFNYMQVLSKGRDYPVYAKTGTSDWAKDGLVFNIPRGAAKDKWMISSTSQYTNAVWVGYDKGIKDKGTYFNSYKSSLNLTGKINVMLLDAVEEISPTKPTAIERPNDIEDITYILGSYPYAYPDGTHQTVTAEIRKGHPALTDVSKSYYGSTNLTLGGINVKMLEDGSLAVTWYGGGGCSEGVKDLTLNDGKNYIPASGRCIFDHSGSVGASYFGTVYIDEVPLYNISSTSGYYQGWPGDLYGNIKVCGGFSTENGTSNTECGYITY